MNIWVEYWEYEDTRSNSHAQMKEQAKWIPPKLEDIKKRFFPDYNSAQVFAKSMQEQGHQVRIKKDGII